MSKADEIEALRRRMIAETEKAWREAARAGAELRTFADYAPGATGATGALEALYGARMCHDIIGAHVAASPTVLIKPLWFALATRAA